MNKSIGLFVLLLLASVGARANVIFPAFAAAYISTLFFPVALISALTVEALIYRWRCSSLSIPTILMLVVAVNVVSWFAGVVITGVLPSGLVNSEEGIVTGGPNFSLYATLAFPVAYVLSVLIEGAVLKLSAVKFTIAEPFKLSLIANTGSYIVLSLLVWVLK